MLVEFVDFPEAHTYGEDAEEALARAQDALATIVEAYVRDRQSIPEPSSPAPVGSYLVRLPALTAAKVELYKSMRAAGLTKTGLAKRLGWHLPQVDRLLDVHHASRLDQLEAAFDALGKELFVAAKQRRRPGPVRPSLSGAATGIGSLAPRQRRRKTRPGRRERQRSARG